MIMMIMIDDGDNDYNDDDVMMITMTDDGDDDYDDYDSDDDDDSYDYDDYDSDDDADHNSNKAMDYLPLKWNDRDE